MTKILIELSEEENQAVELAKVYEKLHNKSDAIKHIIQNSKYYDG